MQRGVHSNVARADDDLRVSSQRSVAACSSLHSFSGKAVPGCGSGRPHETNRLTIDVAEIAHVIFSLVDDGIGADSLMSLGGILLAAFNSVGLSLPLEIDVPSNSCALV